MKVKCTHCDFEWEYKGRFKVHTTCPDCQKKTAIQGDTTAIQGDTNERQNRSN